MAFNPVPFADSVQAARPELGQDYGAEAGRCAAAQDPAQNTLEWAGWRLTNDRDVGDSVEQKSGD
jgi:hypothetical protein